MREVTANSLGTISSRSFRRAAPSARKRLVLGSATDPRELIDDD
jgi:hypothetical protein